MSRHMSGGGREVGGLEVGCVVIFLFCFRFSLRTHFFLSIT